MNTYTADLIVTETEAEQIGRYLEKRAPTGITAEQYIEMAKPEKSPLHNIALEWDDTLAAHEHRLSQARNILNHILITIDKPNGEQERTRAYHAISVENQRDKTYVPQSIVWTDTDMRTEVLARAHRELEQWARRYEQYEELAELAAAVVKVREALAA